MRIAITRIATFALLLGLVSFATITVSAQNESSSTLEITNDGSWNVTVCAGGEFGTVGVTSSQGGVVATTVTICYEDDTTGRDAYSVTLEASNFDHSDPTVDGEISSENLRVKSTSSPVRSTIEGCTLSPFGDDIGLIFAVGAGGERMAPVDAPGDATSYAWGENSLQNPVMVGIMTAGTGTASCVDSAMGVTADVELELTVPAAQYPGDYVSTLEINVPAVIEP